jgi:chemotaxis protein CheX
MPDPQYPRARPIPPSPPKDLRAHFHLKPVPAQVDQIAGLVNGKETASMEEITRIINRDKQVTQRCMITAFPKAQSREGATLSMATTRLGLSRVISLIVSDLLTASILETFRTMIALEMKTEDPTQLPMPPGGFLVASARFKGRATGDVLLAFPHSFARYVTATLLGGAVDAKWPAETVEDTVGELVNIVTGNLQSRLCDAGLPSEMGLPEVKSAPILPSVTILGGSSDRFYFRSGNYNLGVNLCISPFSKGPA